MSQESSLEQFTRLVREHDLTFTFSDDPSVWRRGDAERTVIKELAKQLPREQAVAIWNAEVDRCIHDGYRATFYWTV